MDFNNSIDLLTTEEYIKILIDDFVKSDERKLMLDGESYYKVENTAIKNRKMYYYDSIGVPHVDETQPNHKIAHAFLPMFIDDKINYLLSKEMSITCENEDYLKKVLETIGDDFQDRLSTLGADASKKGISWLHPYIDEEGKFKIRFIEGEQVYPLWLDNEHKNLDGVVWFYEVEMFEGKERKTITRAEYWTRDKVAYYVRDNSITSMGTFLLDSERYLNVDEHMIDENNFLYQFIVDGKPSGWGFVPFIAFKNNEAELSDLKFIKDLIDNYDFTRSDLQNMLDKIKGTVYALRGYGGENLGEFMHDLSMYGAIKLDEDGGLETFTPTINVDASKTHAEMLKDDIFSFGGGVDKTNDKFGSAPSGIALKFLFSGLDLKCNKIEKCFKSALNELLKFVDIYLSINDIQFEKDKITIIFNRDIAINESQSIADCQASMGVISNRTIVANHPWTVDVDEELKKIEEERKETFSDYSFGGEVTKNGETTE